MKADVVPWPDQDKLGQYVDHEVSRGQEVVRGHETDQTANHHRYIKAGVVPCPDQDKPKPGHYLKSCMSHGQNSVSEKITNQSEVTQIVSDQSDEDFSRQRDDDDDVTHHDQGLDVGSNSEEDKHVVIHQQHPHHVNTHFCRTQCDGAANGLKYR